VRNGLRYASRKYWAKITSEMRDIYTAPTVEAAEARFGEFAENWRALYPAMIQSWENAWEEFVPFLEFPVELRKIVYTTNAVESLNARFRRDQISWSGSLHRTPSTGCLGVQLVSELSAS
jgi:putative transposase